MRAILMYHSIDDSGSPISVPESAFRAHVRFFASGRVPVVPLAGLLKRHDDEDAIALTFDDGFASYSERALPLLEAHGLPSTVFVVPGHVGGTNVWGGIADPAIPVLPLMGWDALARSAERGADVGAHTRSHPHLTRLGGAACRDEIVGSADDIENTLGVRPTSFAYPYGYVNDAVARVARDEFANAFTTEFRAVSSADDRALIPRLDAYYFREPGQLETWGTPAFRRRLWLRATGRRVRRLVHERSGR